MYAFAHVAVWQTCMRQVVREERSLLSVGMISAVQDRYCARRITNRKNRGDRMALVFAICLLTGVVHAEIKPFGPFQWGSGLLETIRAAESIGDGKPTIQLSGPAQPVYATGADRERLPKLLEEMLQRTIPRLYSDARTHEGMTATVSVGYGDMTVLASHQDLAVTVKDVSILGVLFRVKATLMTSLGFAIEHPERVYKDATGRYSFPMMLVSVGLASESPALPDKVDEINELLLGNYEEYSSNGSLDIWNGTLSGFVRDSDNNGFRAECNSESCYINYATGRLAERMEEVYRRFLAAREADAAGEDLSGEL